MGRHAYFAPGYPDKGKLTVNNTRTMRIVAGLALGIGLGVALSNIALGIGLGIAFGAAFSRIDTDSDE